MASPPILSRESPVLGLEEEKKSDGGNSDVNIDPSTSSSLKEDVDGEEGADTKIDPHLLEKDDLNPVEDYDSKNQKVVEASKLDLDATSTVWAESLSINREASISQSGIVDNEMEKKVKEEEEFDEFDDFGEFEHDIPICTFMGDWQDDFQDAVNSVFGLPETPKTIEESSLDPDRILSLWQKLIEMPVLQRPDWLRSSIRHIFLVTMGLPVDLDELLPTPSTQGSFNSSRTIELSSVTLPKSEDEPYLDYSAARRLCSINKDALTHRSHESLQQHIELLESTLQQAVEVARYWTDKRDSALSDKLLYETVVDDLVQHSKRLRNSGRKFLSRRSTSSHK